MKKILRSLGLVLAFVLLTAGAYAAASGDSLISLSYLKNTFFPNAVKAGEEASDKLLDKALDDALAQLNAVGQPPAGGGGTGLSSDTLQRREWSDGQIITLPTGGVFVLLDGGADPTWDVLSPQDGLALPTAGIEAPALTNAQTYILSSEMLSARYQQAVQSRAAGGPFALDVGQGGIARQEYPLCMVKLHHTDSADGEDYIQTYYLELYGAVLIPPDVSPSDSYYEAVKYVLAQGYFSGTDDGRFDPSGELTRAQLSQVLWTMGGSLNSKMSQFSDVTSNDWFYRSVSWCQQEELIAGYSTTTFAPHDRLSREQMISILFRYARNSGATLRSTADLSQFSDADQVSDWALDSIRWAVTNGLIPSSDTALRPSDTVTRAELASTLYSYEMNLSSRGR